MRPTLLVGAGLFALAVVVAPAPAATRLESPGTPAWPSAVVRLAALGRTYAAADLAWLKCVQIVGSDLSAREGYKNLEGWADLLTSLDASFDSAYAVAVVMLVTDEARAPIVDAILDRGERALPTDYQLPMLRAFSAYFGRLDGKLAAMHYERAAGLPNAPPYLAELARRLRERETTCADLKGELRTLLSESTSDSERLALRSNALRVLEHCEEAKIEDHARRFRLNKGREPTIDELVDNGMEPPLAPPGRCWILAGGSATLGECR